MRGAVARVLCVALVLVTALGCTATSSTPRRSSEPESTRTSSQSGSTDPPSSTTVTTSAPAAPDTLHPGRDRTTRQGMWWAVDSTVAVNHRSLSNVRHFYRTSHNPVAWGRYLLGHFGVHPDELRFATAHHIALYFLVPDKNCSGCAGGDACGNDRTAAQARVDARDAISAARRLRLPSGTALFKDIEQVGACSGELSRRYVLTWFRQVGASPYRPAFYGNSTAQDYDFPRVFCAAAEHDPTFAKQVVLAQDEPEPDIGAASGTIGPRTAPRFAPKHPSCVSRTAVGIWQYGESISDDNLTDIDEIRPGTPGLLAPGGTVTG